MKKLIKTLTITGGICAGLGLIFLIIGLILGGGTIDFSDAMSVQGSDVSSLIHKLTPIDSEYRDDDIENLDSERWECTSASGIKNLQIEMDAGYLEIKQYEGREIQVYIQQNDRKTKIEQEGDDAGGKVRHHLGGAVETGFSQLLFYEAGTYEPQALSGGGKVDEAD